MRKIKELGQLTEGRTLCTIDVVGLYPNIPHDEALGFLSVFLDSRVDKQVTTDTLIVLGELVLKNTFLNLLANLQTNLRNGHWYKVHEYLRMCVQVSIPRIGNETSFEPLFEICIRTKDVTLSVVLNDRVLGTKGCETLGVEWE